MKSFNIAENDVLAIIKTLDANKAYGCDNMSVKMIDL